MNIFDHAKAIPDLLNRGIKCLMSEGTAVKTNTTGRNLKIVKALEQFKLDQFTILPFDAEHDAAQAFGYMILDNISGEKTVFLTDSFYCKYTFKNVNFYVVECNYVTEILTANVENGSVTKIQADRLWNSHFSLDNLKKFFKGKENIQGVVLIHLSDKNSDEARMIDEIQSVVGCKVDAARPGEIIEMGIQF